MKHIKTDKNAIEVRNNNVDQALRIMKKKLMESGLFNELREKEKAEKLAREKEELRAKKEAAKRQAEEGY